MLTSAFQKQQTKNLGFKPHVIAFILNWKDLVFYYQVDIGVHELIEV